MARKITGEKWVPCKRNADKRARGHLIEIGTGKNRKYKAATGELEETFDNRPDAMSQLRAWGFKYAGML